MVDTALGAPHNPALLTGTRVREDAMFDGGGVSRVAKGADCKSAGLRLRRFESYLPHHRREAEVSHPRRRANELPTSDDCLPGAGVAQW